MTLTIKNISMGKHTPHKGCYPKNDGRIYIHISQETLMENLQNRRVRPYNVYKKEVIPKVLKYLNQNGYPNLNEKNFKPKWSQTADCKCGCSPGFIVDNYELRYKYISVQLKKKGDQNNEQAY